MLTSASSARTILSVSGCRTKDLKQLKGLLTFHRGVKSFQVDYANEKARIVFDPALVRLKDIQGVVKGLSSGTKESGSYPMHSSADDRPSPPKSGVVKFSSRDGLTHLPRGQTKLRSSSNREASVR